MLELFKRLWARQNAFVRRIMTAQNTVLMAVAYIVGVGPVALGFRLLGRSAIDRPAPDPTATSYWITRPHPRQTMDAASRRW